jgi:hypothetical protein
MWEGKISYPKRRGGWYQWGRSAGRSCPPPSHRISITRRLSSLRFRRPTGLWESFVLAFFVTAPESTFRAPTSIRASGRRRTIFLSSCDDPELGCSTVAVNRPGTPSGPYITSHVLPANLWKNRVDPRGLEPLTSAMRERHDSLLEVSGDCKIPANDDVSVLTRFPAFQEIYPGCCTVNAKLAKGAWESLRNSLMPV